MATARLATVGRVIVAVIALVLTFLVATVLAVVVHLDRPATRRMVALQVNGVLGNALDGDVRIERIGSLGLDGVAGVCASVHDPSGVEVLRVDDIRVRVRALAAVRSALLGSGPVAIDVSEVWIGNVAVAVDADAEGNLRIAAAFASKKPSPPPSPGEPGRGVLVDAPKVRLGHAWAHGVPSAGVVVDADLWDLAARAKVDPVVTRATLDDVYFATRGLPQNANPRGALRGTFAIPAANGQGFDLDAVFDGLALGMPTTLEVKMVDRRLDVRLDTRGETLGEFAIAEPLLVRAKAHGDLPEIEARVHAAAGHAQLDGDAVIVAARTTHVTGKLAARDVDVAKLVPSAPVTKLGFDARADVVLDDRGVSGSAAIDTLPGFVDGRAVPSVEVRGLFEGLAAAVRARVRDPNLPTEIAIDVTPRGESGDARAVSAVLRSRVPDLQRLPVIGNKLAGSAEASASALVLLPEAVIESSRVHVEVQRLRVETLGLASLAVTARASGTADRLAVDAEAHAGELALGSLPFASVDAKARIERRGDAITVRDATLEAVRLASEKMTASARLVHVTGNDLRASGVEIRGLGEPIHAEAVKTGRSIQGTIDAPRIDLPLVARLAGKDLGVTRGTLGIRGDGAFRGHVAKAKLHAEVHDLAMRSVHRGEMTLDGAIDDRQIDLDLLASLGETGKVALRAERLLLGGAVDDPHAWRDIAGKVHVSAEVDMARAARFIPPEQLPVADLHGSLSFQGRVGRDSATAPPEVMLHAHTVGFGCAGREGDSEELGGVHIEKTTTQRAGDFDVGLDIRNDGTSGLTNVAFHATDRHGAIVAVDAKAILPYEALLRDPVRSREMLETAPFGVKLTIPPRRLDELPTILAPPGIGGAIAANLDASGTVVDPRLHADVRVKGVRVASVKSDVTPDGVVGFDYDGHVAGLKANVRAGAKDLLEVTGRAELRARDLLSKRDDLPWRASVQAKLASFPLESVPQLLERRVRGDVSGQVSLEGLHDDAVVKGKLDFDRLAVGEAQYTSGNVTLDSTGNKLVAALRVDQEDGNLELEAASGLAWGKELVPTLDHAQPVTANLRAHAFRAAAIQPFVEGAVPVFDGRIDANAKAELVPGKPGAALAGTVNFHDGTVFASALGEELRGVKASVQLLPNGTIKVTDVVAKGTQGEVRADANVKLDGTRLADAVANVRIPKDKPLSLSVQGSPIGELAGTITLKAKQSADGKDTTIAVEIPTLGVELPQVTKTGVQSLDAKSNIYVGVKRGRERFVTLPLAERSEKDGESKQDAEASRLDVDVRLGRITIERGNQLRVELTGNPKVAIAGDETKVTGQVTVARGWIDVHGKKFEVEKGTVTFNGESPPDPVIVATAGWTAADGTRIHADFVGPVTTGKVTLRSEPPRPQNEILAVVLFGTADGANPTPQQRSNDGTMKTAVGLGGGYLAEGLTEALDDLGGIQATARIDSTESNNPRPELSFQVSPKVSVGFAHVIGTPPITEPDRNYANVEYRIRMNWSLKSTFGDRGSTLFDAIWQRRY